jgi:predicted ATP-binding protein involved in virulence
MRKEKKMNIKHLKLTNFKKFADLEVDFNDGVNLFVGVNGSGKSSILEAINVAVGGFFGSQEQKMQHVIDYDQIRMEQGFRKETASVDATSSYIENHWTRTIKRDTKTNDSKEIRSAANYGKKFFDAFENIADKTVAPLIAYYSTQRLFKDSKVIKYDASLSRRNGYLQCLRSQAIKTTLDEWLYNAKIRQFSKQSQGLPSQDSILDNVTDALQQTISKFANIEGDVDLKIYFNPDYGTTPFLAYGNKENIPMSSYSDGFRSVLYLVIDLVWRASQLNPFLSLSQISEQVNGVVTIDEIDLHLHPRWQAEAIGHLQKLFPKVQFFITTHSPIVVGNFEHGTLYRISEGEVEKYEGHYFGLSADDIISQILEAEPRNKATEANLDKLFLLIDKGEKEKYVPLLEALKGQLGNYDANIIRAESLIEWLNTPE